MSEVELEEGTEAICGNEAESGSGWSFTRGLVERLSPAEAWEARNRARQGPERGRPERSQATVKRPDGRVLSWEQRQEAGQARDDEGWRLGHRHSASVSDRGERRQLNVPRRRPTSLTGCGERTHVQPSGDRESTRKMLIRRRRARSDGGVPRWRDGKLMLGGRRERAGQGHGSGRRGMKARYVNGGKGEAG